MTEFWLTASVITALMLLAAWLFLRHSGMRSTAGDSRDERARSNIAIYRSRAQELDELLRQETIDAAQHQRLLQEAKQQLLDDVGAVTGNTAAGQAQTATRSGSAWLPMLAVILAPVLALLLYLPQGFSLGASIDMQVREQLQALGEASDVAAQQQSLSGLVSTLQKHSRAVAQRADLQHLLARLYSTTADHVSAAGVYRDMLLDNPEDSQLLASLAQSQFLAGGGEFSPEVSDLLARSLAIAPDNPLALSMSGMQAFGREDYAGAVRFWQSALAVYPPQSSHRQVIEDSIQRAQQKLAGDQQAAGPGDSEGATAEAMAGIRINVDIAPAQLQASDSPQTPVFIFARAASGPPMPLAAVRVQLSDLPAEVVLSDANSMTGGSLATAGPVVVMARLARSGEPVGLAGDSEGRARSPVNAAVDPMPVVDVLIDSRK